MDTFSLRVYLMRGAKELFCVLCSVSRRFMGPNVGSYFQCDYLPVTFGVLNPGGSCIIKKTTASLTTPGHYSKLGATMCHIGYSNVRPASPISNG